MIKILNGDVTNPCVDGNKIVIHLCNNIGAFGGGVSGAIGKKWPYSESVYRESFLGKEGKRNEKMLGLNQFVVVDDDTWVCNMIAQNGIGGKHDKVDYIALKKCLDNVGSLAKGSNATVHSPLIGCGLAGSSWDKIFPLFLDTEKKYHVDFYIYKWEIEIEC